MPPKSTELGERISGLEASFSALEKYEHERWHALANTMQPIAMLPERITRDIAKLQGSFDGRLAAVTKEIERSITVAVEKALASVNDDLRDLKSRVAVLERTDDRQTGAKGLALWCLQSPLIAWLAAAAVVIAAWWKGDK